MTISEALVLEFDEEVAKARRLVERAREESFAWHPPGQSMTLGLLVNSIVEVPTQITTAISQNSWEVTRVDKSGTAAMLASCSGTSFLEAFDSNVVAARNDIVGTSDERLLGSLSFESNGKTVLAMPREAVIRHVVLGRLRWHRALLAKYLDLARGAIRPSPDKMQDCSAAESSECRQA
jgi:hypothetical protein